MLKSLLIHWVFRYRYHKIHSRSVNTAKSQQKVFNYLVQTAKNTRFGKDHHFEHIDSYESFKQHVPLRCYEDLTPYITAILAGNENVLWPSKPLYLAKTSGTTSGAKYIPITKESMPYHIAGARNSLICYLYHSKNFKFFKGRMIFLQGSPVLEEKNAIKIGRLSGIVAHYVPFYLRRNRMPSWETNCIENWEEKIQRIVQETSTEDMTLIGGIPPWIINYFELLLKNTTQPTVKTVFPNLSLIVTGGVNFEPYRKRFQQLLGKSIDIIQTYPASEGFIAYQDKLGDEGLLLQLDAGIFYEFIPMETYYDKNPSRICLEDVVLEKDYALVLNTNAGLWGYLLGDTVRFVSKNPPRIIVTGRVKHFISAFGEHVIGYEVECALRAAVTTCSAQVSEFTVAPQVNPESGLPYHQWFIEFEKEPDDMARFTQMLDDALCKKNTYYKDLIQGSILRSAVVTPVPRGTFNAYMKAVGKLGGQNKIPHLSNDRNIVDKLNIAQYESF